MKNCKNFRAFSYIYIYIYIYFFFFFFLVVQGTLIFNTPPIQSYKNSHLNRIHEHFFYPWEVTANFGTVSKTEMKNASQINHTRQLLDPVQ